MLQGRDNEYDGSNSEAHLHDDPLVVDQQGFEGLDGLP